MEITTVPSGFAHIISNDRARVLNMTAPATEYGLEYLPFVNMERYQVGTSTSRVFRRCQRKWAFQSSYRLGLEGAGDNGPNINFWFGSAIHFVMEDYFGWNKFGNPKRALKAYYDAFDSEDRPTGADEYYTLGLGMLDYLLQWYPKHNIPGTLDYLETAWFYHSETNNAWSLAKPFAEGAIPGVEISMTLNMGVYVAVDSLTGSIIGKVRAESFVHDSRVCEIEFYNTCHKINTPDVNMGDEETVIPYMDLEHGEERGFRILPVTFHGTVDKICVDSFGRLFLLDYKTAKSADIDKLDTDDQISRYMWAAEQYLGLPIEGFIYFQMTKDVPKAPRELKDGNLSSDKSQKTTYALYRTALINRYGDVSKSPSSNIGCLNALADKEFPEGDGFIRWDRSYRNAAQKVAIYYAILAEIEEMINANKACYPAPTRDCIWDCSFRSACLALDKADFEEFQLCLSGFAPRKMERGTEEESWRKKIKWPTEVLTEPTNEELGLDTTEFNIILPVKKKEEE